MADLFSSNPSTAEQLSGLLATVAGSLSSGATALYGYPHETGAAPVDAQLQSFWTTSNTFRQIVDQLVTSAAGLLAGLAQKSTATDRSLAAQVPVTPAPTPEETQVAAGRLARA